MGDGAEIMNTSPTLSPVPTRDSRTRPRRTALPALLLPMSLALLACADPSQPGVGMDDSGLGTGSGSGGASEGPAEAPDAGGQGSGGQDLSDDPGCEQDPDTRIPCKFDGLPDPAGWSVHPDTGLRFRRVTAQERQQNGWPEGAFLVEAGEVVDAVELGAATLPPLLVPVSDDDAIAVQLDQIAKSMGPAQVEVTTGGASSTTPTVVSYVSPEHTLPDLLINVLGTEGALRGLVAWGTAGGYDVQVATYAPRWFVEEFPGGPSHERLARVSLRTLLPDQQESHDQCNPIAVGGCDGMCNAWKPADCGELWTPWDDNAPCTYEGSHPCVNDQPTVDLGLCDNGNDDDGDERADYGGVLGQYEPDPQCNHTEGCFALGTGAALEHQHRYESGEPFVFTGNLYWCAEDGDWYSRMHSLALSVTQMYDTPTGYAPYDELGRNEILRFVAGQCWVMDPEEIPACEKDGDCGPFGPQGANPYVFAGADYSSAAYLDAAWSAVAHAAGAGLKQPATISVVLVSGFAPHIPWDGEGRFPWSATPGAAAVNMSFSSPHAIQIAHEMGHTLGLQHKDDGYLMSSAVGAETKGRLSWSHAVDVLDTVRSFAAPRAYSFGG